MRGAFVKNPLVSFFVLTFVLSWGVGALQKGTPLAPDGLFVSGILIAALLVTGLTEGRAGLLNLGRRLVHWRVPLRWYAVVVAFPVLIVGTATALMPLLGGASLDWAERPGLAHTAMLLIIFIVVPLAAPLSEEIAWRGFALPRMLAKRSPLTASLVLV